MLAVCLAVYVIQTRHWALVNDGAQISYVCFLIDHGRSPYRDLLEMNMPGTYLVHWAVMHGLGIGDSAWRAFDLTVTGLAGVAMVWITRPYGKFAGLFAGILFALFHGRDGPAQAGQRDLVIAMLLVWACAFVIYAVRTGLAWPVFFCGLCGMAAVSIKPVALATVLFLLLAAVLRLRGQRLRVAVLGMAGMATPLAGVFVFLARHGSMRAFGYLMKTVLPFYAALARLPAGRLLKDCVTPSLAALWAIAGLVAWAQRRDQVRRDQVWESTVLLGCAILGVLSFILQGKGFAYHRYPGVAFVLLWAAILFTNGIRGRGLTRIAGWTGLIFGAVLSPLYTARVRQWVWNDAMTQTLMSDLRREGGTALSGDVQCLATMPDCDTALLRLKLVQSTGLMYDFFVFGDGRLPVFRQARQRILPELVSRPPKVIVVGRGLYPVGGEYEKLARWPELNDLLRARYQIREQRVFAPAQDGVRGYRLYVRR